MAICLAPNLDLLFTEAGDVPQRVAAAADAGFDAVEFWTTSDRDVSEIARVAQDRGVRITSILGEPRTDVTRPETDLTAYYDAFAASVDRARALDCPQVVIAGSTGYMRMRRKEQLALVADIYREAVERTAGSGVTLLFENFNTRVDHPGALLDNVADTIVVARAIASDRVGVLYDVYHSLVQGEDPAAALSSGMDVIRALQIADVPGRGEPGSGALDWRSLMSTIAASGYDGAIGLEFYPTGPTLESVRLIREVVDEMTL